MLTRELAHDAALWLLEDELAQLTLRGDRAPAPAVFAGRAPRSASPRGFHSPPSRGAPARSGRHIRRLVRRLVSFVRRRWRSVLRSRGLQLESPYPRPAPRRAMLGSRRRTTADGARSRLRARPLSPAGPPRELRAPRGTSAAVDTAMPSVHRAREELWIRVVLRMRGERGTPRERRRGERSRSSTRVGGEEDVRRERARVRDPATVRDDLGRIGVLVNAWAVYLHGASFDPASSAGSCGGSSSCWCWPARCTPWTESIVRSRGVSRSTGEVERQLAERARATAPRRARPSRDDAPRRAGGRPRAARRAACPERPGFEVDLPAQRRFQSSASASLRLDEEVFVASVGESEIDASVTFEGGR